VGGPDSFIIVMDENILRIGALARRELVDQGAWISTLSVTSNPCIRLSPCTLSPSSVQG
jgi:hypothetical protein